MTEMNEVQGAATPVEEMSGEQVRVIGDGDDFDIQCEYCGMPVYYRPWFCPSCGGTVAAVDQNG